MKKILVLSMMVAFVVLGSQAFASPPIKPPVEGFVITSETYIDCKMDADGNNSVVEEESFNWTYYEGWGKGVFFPDGIGPCAQFEQTTWCDEDETWPALEGNVVGQLGFTEGAELAYSQTFKAKNGNTIFDKNFLAQSDPDPGDDNLVVTKHIEFNQDGLGTGTAEHTEKVGLSVISMGSEGASNPANGILSLCPWAANNGGGTSSGGYPATNEAIAAGSSFKVTKILFNSTSNVNSSILPKLAYEVPEAKGEGFIEAGFVVDLWEAPEGYVWKPIPTSYDDDDDPTTPPVEVPWLCGTLTQCPCCPGNYVKNADGQYELSNVAWILPKAYGEPPLASRVKYKEHAEAEGLFTFTKKVSYQSTMPGGPASGAFPINQVP